MAEIEIKNVQAAYDGRIIIPDVSLTIPKGKITMLIGPNGCGKSTLLKTVSRILPVKKGKILLDGKDLHKMASKSIAKKLAILPQTPLIPEGITVKALVAYGRFPYQRALSGLKKEDYEIINWAMEKTKVLELQDRKVEELSGGQRQRAWIALALAQKTDVLVLDEPTTYLDMAHQLEILELLRQLNHDEGTTIVVVIHELNHASKFADYIVGMKKGEVIFKGKPIEVINPENLRALYDIEAVIEQSPERGYPICTDYSRAYGG